MPVEREVIRKNILEKGFRENSDRKNPNHDYYFLFYEEKHRGDVWIRLSRGSHYKVYSDALLRRQARILHIGFGDLYKFVTCVYSKEDFIGVLAKSGRISR
jgi:hypothetical protein